ncbi:MAG TPA: GAF domain-containing sensor histidine kinase [Allosphingosinicella sp.]|nr:GAF domain-containing sensor histidine kinase [Allosphingosinicella sp.]
MIPPPIPNQEEARLAALKRYQIEGVGREAAFDHATDLAAHLFEVPISLVSIVGAEEQRFKGATGLAAPCTSRDVSFCGHALHRTDVLVVEDALKDERFFDNPLVTGDPHIRFYAGAPLLLGDGTIPGTLCLIDRKPRSFSREEEEDLTRLAKLVVVIIEMRLESIVAEERQHALARMKDEFVAATSHELRTPLTSIAGSLGLLLAGAAGDLPERARRLVGIAHSNSKRLVGLVNDILDMDKLASGKMHLDSDPVDVAQVLGETVEANGGFAADHCVRLVSDPVPSGLKVLADHRRLLQVLTNLLSNAVKFSPKDGTVTLSARESEEGRVRITVADKGRGIPEEFKSRIFSRFAQADASDEREKGGTGLGLAIVKEIVTQMGGAVSFDTALGEGTSFHVDLPAGELS